MFPSFLKPKPASPTRRNEQLIPEGTANIFDKITFGWIYPLLKTGYTRPIEESDVWHLDDARLTECISDRLEQNFYNRCPPSQRPAHLTNSVPARAASSTTTTYSSDEGQGYTVVDGAKSFSDQASIPSSTPRGIKPTFLSRLNPRSAYRKHVKVSSGKLEREADEYGNERYYDSSLIIALLQTTWRPLLVSFFFKVSRAVLDTTGSLVTKQLIAFITTSHTWATTSDAERLERGLRPPSGIGRGISLAIGIALMQEVASLCGNHYYIKSFGCGFLMRSALIDQIARKSLRLSPKSRGEYTNGRQITAISADASYAEWCFPIIVQAVVEPITLIIAFILLIVNLGPSALVGFGVLAVSAPWIGYMTHGLVTTRQQQLQMVDRRVRLTTEILSNIRSLKLYAYEAYFGARITDCRKQELARVRKRLRIRAVMQMVTTFILTVAAVLSFVTYSLAGNQLDTATIFASLQLFNVIQTPMQVLPTVFSFLADGHVAVGRIAKLLRASEHRRELAVFPDQQLAVDAAGDFAFETAVTIHCDSADACKGEDIKVAAEKNDRIAPVGVRGHEQEASDLSPTGLSSASSVSPFFLKDISLQITRGAFVCIFGRIGSGKSALLQGLIGEMRQTRGHVKFGGRVSLVTQLPWIQSASVRENILFGQKRDDTRLQRVVQACALTKDLDLLLDGIQTEIGERGVNLSGGQRSRIALARAAYSDAEVILMDDPLSAVDSHVSSHLLSECLLGAMKGRTRILVTHTPETARHADLILVMDNGRVIHQGSFSSIQNTGVFQALEKEELHTGEKSEEILPAESDVAKSELTGYSGKESKSITKNHVDDERNTGSISWSVYAAYTKAMSASGYLGLALFSILAAECSQIGNILFLGFWSASSIPGFDKGQYMGIYAGLGVGLGLFTFIGAYATCLAGIRASFLMFERALRGVLRSPVAFHDRTPSGRIQSRLAKDVESVDDRLAFQWYQLSQQLMSVFGTVALVFYTYAYLGILFVPMLLVYFGLASFFRRTSRELKRIDSTTRSFIYSYFGEQLVGISSIRTFKQEKRFLRRISNAIDYEFRFHYTAMVAQRWLSVRLDLLGSLLVLGIALFGVFFRNDVAPSKFGVVLTYSMQSTLLLSQLVIIYALVEQEMNTCERILYYGDLPLEASPRVNGDPDNIWPSRGEINVEGLQLRYRSGLPLVLKGLSFHVKAGEKIGIVGRTGAGKSSLLQALFRIVEPCKGRVVIDGVDTSTIGLDTLRQGLSVIPQEVLLFSGTMRDNLDPQGNSTDAELHDALRRCNLLQTSEGNPGRFSKFKLDAEVSDEGGNFSGGERQLVALCRAVIKNRKVLMLDEATSAVDPQTDAAIQKTIRNEFKDVTLLCIAHRLATIAFYDRVLVLDHGTIAEFDTPLNLFDREGSIFRGMCDAAKLSKMDIIQIRKNGGLN